jgi:hypothetical protein
MGMLLTGRKTTAAQPHGSGLVNLVVSIGELTDRICGVLAISRGRAYARAAPDPSRTRGLIYGAHVHPATLPLPSAQLVKAQVDAAELLLVSG